MAQYKIIASVNNGGQTVTIGMNATPYVKAKDIFLVEGELVPYFVAADPVWDGTNTTVQLTGAYAGPNRSNVDVAFVTDFTYPDNIPVIAQGDVGTAAVFTEAMYRVQDLIHSVAPAGLAQYVDLRDQCAVSAAAAAASANTFTSNFTQYATALVDTQTLFAQRFAFA